MPTITLTTSVKSTVTIRNVADAMNGVGGPMWRWREATMNLAMLNAVTSAPVNNPLNATHRGGRVGEYKRSFTSSRLGSNQYQMRFTISNTAEHAKFVEEGRSASNRRQVFAWVRNTPPGSIQEFSRTRGRPGKFIIRRAVQSAVATTAT